MEDLNKIKLMETTKATFKKINDNFTAVEEAIENNEGAIANKANKASGLSAGTKTKISYNNEGIVISGQDATLDDIADGTTRKLSDYLTKTEAGSTYIPQSQKGQANGVATLDSGGKVPSSQLPSYVDDVLEYASKSNFPATGESGKIYVALDTNLTYRWGGSEYIEISQSLALGETASTAYAGNKGKQNADNIATLQSYFDNGKAKDADKLDGHDSTYFATKQSVDDIDTILDGFGDIVTHNASEFQTKLTSQTAYSGKGTSTKVAKITTNNLGQVTAVEEVDIDFSSVDTKTTYAFTASDSRYSALQDGVYTLTIQNTNKYPIACYNANGEAVMVTLGQANNTITMKTDEKFAGTIVAL